MPVDPGTFTWVHDPLTYAVVGLITFVLVVLRAVITGRLIPRRSLDQLSELWERRVTESLDREQAWKEAFGSADQRADDLAQQVDRLTVLGETTVRLLEALPSGEKERRAP